MRIGQIARKLDVTPSQIIQYLEELGIETDKGVNTKIMPAGIEKIEEKFGNIYGLGSSPKVKSEDEKVILGSEQENESVNESEFEIQNTEVVPEKEDEKESAPAVVPPVATEENETTKEVVEEKEIQAESIEVIRPEYVKLQGLKVVDKIELPEPKVKKEETPAEPIEEIETEPAREKEEKPEEESHIITEADIKADMNRHYRERRKKERKPQQKQRKKRTPLTYEQKLEKERKQAEKNKLEAEKKRKEQKRKAYEERLKNVQSATAPKKAKKKKPESFPVKEKYKKEPKSLWGKFMKWLNT